MFVCEKCGGEVVYIATSPTVTIECDSELLEVYNKNGHKFTGYPIHKCEVDTNEQDKE